jgi:hypothetical protein
MSSEQPDVVPRLEPVSCPELQRCSSVADSEHVTPRTENYREPLNEEERLVLSSGNLVSSSRGDTLRRAPLRNTSELVSLLPLHEALIVMEAATFVDAGNATWVELGWSE